jgi:gamma-glutamyltranspeptidase / glutathione hydrolase
MRPLATLLSLAILAGGTSARCNESGHFMVVASDKAAAEAGAQILRAGGSATDAAIAVQMVLTLVEPQASGIGGGAVLMHFDGASHEVITWDGRETAPAAVTSGAATDGIPAGGQAVGVPGAVKMLEALHHEHGRLPWADLMAPAIRLAEEGIPVSPSLAQAILARQAALQSQPAARAVFFTPEGIPLAAGSTLTNPALAQTLRAIAAGGANGLLRGPIAAEIATTVRGDAQPGLITTDDLAAYTPRRRPAACEPYRGRTICSTAPPGGGVLLLQALGLLDHFDLPALDPTGADAAELLIQAEQLALADRGRTIADPDFAAVPVDGVLNDGTLAAQARQIDPHHAIQPPQPDGDPVAEPVPAEAAQKPQPEHGTSSIAIVDAQGNAICMTSTIGGPFGSGLFVHGFPLNAALDDFTADPAPGGPQAANRMQPGKRPATAMAPAFVLDHDGRLLAVVGSTGGAHIPDFVLQAVVGSTDWHLDPAQALAQPHVGATRGPAELEEGTPAASLAASLQARGQAVQTMTMPSGTAMIALTPDGLVGATDPRGQGAVAGE